MEATVLKYGEHDLQRVLVWELEVDAATATKPWVIYIHGGAWQDPRILADSFLPTITHLLNPAKPDNSSTPTPQNTNSPTIAGLASIDYRLSAHPSFPQDPASTPSAQLRNARYPHHVRDVRDAIALLQEKYGFGEEYVLVGHSVGATMGFEMVMGGGVFDLAGSATKEHISLTIPTPRMLIGIAGIYDLRACVDGHASIPAYRDFVTNALGEDEERWDALSPARYRDFGTTWKNAARVIVAQSRDDELVEMEQWTNMADVLGKQLGKEKVISVEVKGTHDEVWEKGGDMAALIQRCLAAWR